MRCTYVSKIGTCAFVRCPNEGKPGDESGVCVEHRRVINHAAVIAELDAATMEVIKRNNPQFLKENK